ncbi:MAG: hypothetical protein ACI9FU_002004 [Granulosicoccus sp.]|jgi:hypothetical protein
MGCRILQAINLQVVINRDLNRIFSRSTTKSTCIRVENNALQNHMFETSINNPSLNSSLHRKGLPTGIMVERFRGLVGFFCSIDNSLLLMEINERWKLPLWL